ncbi:hypothetical protein THASP1DRAFT_31084 [Thamnocephalis sphaerospora]|uniref:Selenoprotein H n=1 Tax=Thamnocephalis sphaerospora TaxID=78915 RepID=A0A4P9XNV7_9FUNG|nr:hypothetical protein THASP1DRAFT_31084 [Thamnocephalis sphaerospora]|eukprot:RKP07101.1 hypothetical protein THASP1DRAFT_31084 [Thamnocephalis sphaerospora]
MSQKEESAAPRRSTRLRREPAGQLTAAAASKPKVAAKKRARSTHSEETGGAKRTKANKQKENDDTKVSLAVQPNENASKAIAKEASSVGAPLPVASAAGDSLVVVFEHCLGEAIRAQFPDASIRLNPSKPRSKSFEVTVYTAGEDGEGKLVWSGIKKAS